MSKLPHLAALILSLSACDSERARFSERAADVPVAVTAFEDMKQVRVHELRTERSMIAASPAMIAALVAQLPITAASRDQVESGIRTMQQQLDEASTAIDRLKDAKPHEWKTRDAVAEGAMHRLEDARDNAWNMLKNAERTDRSS